MSTSLVADLSGLKAVQALLHRVGEKLADPTPLLREIGTNLAYGAIHQFGGQAGRGRKITIPARPYLGLSAADEDKIIGLAQSYLREVLS